MPETVTVAPLDGFDAIAVRAGDDVLVHLSPGVPESNRKDVILYLRRAVRAEPGEVAEVRMPLGEARRLALRVSRAQTPRRVPCPRWPAIAAAAVAATLALPVGAVAALALFGVSQQNAPAPVATPAGSALANGSDDAQPPVVRDPEINTADEIPAAPVSIHPPQRIVRAAPSQVVLEMAAPPLEQQPMAIMEPKPQTVHTGRRTSSHAEERPAQRPQPRCTPKSSKPIPWTEPHGDRADEPEVGS